MRPRAWALMVALSGGALLEARPAVADGGTRSSTAALSAEDLELARYLDMLDEMELLEKMDLVSLLAALDDEEGP